MGQPQPEYAFSYYLCNCKSDNMAYEVCQERPECSKLYPDDAKDAKSGKFSVINVPLSLFKLNGTMSF